MKELLTGAVSVCGVVILIEVAACFCGENEMLRFLRGLSILLLLLSLGFSAVRADWDLSLPQAEAAARGEELQSYVTDQIKLSAGEETAAYLKGLLAAAGLQAEKIEPHTSILEDGSIVCDKVGLLFRYQSDRERAAALLQNVLGDEIEVEVYAWD